MPRYRHDTSAYASAAAAAFAFLETSNSHLADMGELRARATRYRELAEILFDPLIITLARACARELDAEVTLSEKAEKIRRTRQLLLWPRGAHI